MGVFADLFGAVLGYLVIMYVFMWIAGGAPATIRQFTAIYLGMTIAGVFVRACGAADGGPPNFALAWIDLIGGPLAGAVHFMLKRAQTVRP